MNYRLLHALAIMPLLLLLATPSQAGRIYKWTDAQGEVHYTQTPPPDQNVKEMHVNTNAPISGTKTSGDATSADVNNKKASKTPTSKQQAEQQAEREKKNEEVRQENCKRANKRFRTINAGGRLYDVNEKGERVYWDDNKRASELADAQKSVEKWCNQ